MIRSGVTAVAILHASVAPRTNAWRPALSDSPLRHLGRNAEVETVERGLLTILTLADADFEVARRLRAKHRG